MQPTNKPTKQRSRCLYCGSVDRGKGCAFGPHRVHFHAGDDTKCSYCGSTDYGRGCKINPISNLHMHGVNITDSLKVDTQAFLDKEFLMNELTKDFKDFEAFRLNVIDENGNKIRNPETLEEQASYTSLTKTIIRIKKYLGPKVQLLEASNLLEKENVTVQSVEHYKKIVEFKNKIQDNVDELFSIISEAQQAGLSLEEIKKLIGA